MSKDKKPTVRITKDKQGNLVSIDFENSALTTSHTGKAGERGKDGSVGLQGPVGETGSVGSQGLTGADGRDVSPAIVKELQKSISSAEKLNNKRHGGTAKIAKSTRSDITQLDLNVTDHIENEKVHFVGDEKKKVIDHLEQDHTTRVIQTGGGGTSNHNNLQNIGTNAHSVIDTHIGTANIHFTEASIDHGNLNALSLLDDDHTQYATLTNRTGETLNIDNVIATNLTGTVITATQGTINHNTLLNGAGNQHINWTNATVDFLTTGTVTTPTVILDVTESIYTTTGSVIIKSNDVDVATFDGTGAGINFADDLHMNNNDIDGVFDLDVDNDLLVVGKASVGAITSAETKFVVSQDAITTLVTKNISSDLDWQGISGNSAALYGYWSNLRVNPAKIVNVDTLTTGYGLTAAVAFKWDNGPDIGKICSIQAKINEGTLYTGTITELCLFDGITNGAGTGGIITNMYGLHLPDISFATNNWAIKTGAGLVEFGDDLTVVGDIQTDGLNFTSATLLTIDSGGEVTVTKGHHSIDTFGGAANDDLDTINGGDAGEILLILSEDDNRTVRIRNGSVSGGNIFLKHQVESKSFGFTSPAGVGGTFYSAGFYDWSGTDANLTQASLSVTHSAANSASACHIGIVAGGAGVVDTGVVKITVSGTTIDDEGNRAGSQTVDLVADITALSANDYVETTEKWLGQVTIALEVASGSPVNFSLDANYGCSKYEDFGNQGFTVNVVEVVGIAGANDTGFNLRLLHHSSAGWTYAATGFIAGGTVLANMNTDYGPEKNLVNGESFAYKRVDLNTSIAGDGGEGLILEITTTGTKSIETMNIHLGVHTAPNFSYLSNRKQHLIFMKHGPNWLEL